jgi:hypothetical protein
MIAMIDILIVGLLYIIIFILILVYAPEIIIYVLLTFCIIGLIICIVVLGAQFIHDPIGFLYNLVFNNPITMFTDNVLDAMPDINYTIILNQHP